MFKALRAVILVSVGAGALAAVVALTIGKFDDTTGKVIATAFLITAAALLTLICAAGWQRGTLRWLPIGGAVAGTAGIVLLIVGMWTDGPETLWKSAATLIIVGVAIAHMAAMSLVTLPDRYRPLAPVAYALAALVGGYLIAAMWAELDAEAGWRLFGVGMVLLAALTVAIPVLGRGTGTRAVSFGYCPNCGSASMAGEGEVAVCGSCGCRYRVEVA